MRDYYGTKRISAEPEERDGVAGYAVVYEGGYRSWSPKDVFERAYQPLKALSFGHAIEVMRAGGRVRRAGWNGKGMWLVLVPGTGSVVFREGTPYRNAGLVEADINPHVDMFTADGKMQPGWLASQTDMLANDWQLID